VDPAAAATVQEEISSYLVGAGIASLSELVGGLRLPDHTQI
jgi:hypothetical protein